ncbi:MAG: ABC transporter ATP-binding protein [Deltaproteobacteria bacterium]|nr:ABC transporter ATP-binding protein [Deltaproteobacteria bacterium]
MIRIEGLRKRYGRFEAVRGIDLHVKEGEVFGFLGPNGAGKTTTIKMVAGLLKPTAGSVRIGGIDTSVDPVGAKRLIGYIPDRPYLYERLTGDEFLAFVGGVFGMTDADVRSRGTELLAFFGLGNFGGELVEGYSHGMKQRLTLAAAMLHRPRLLVVDEPMVGLDPAGAKLIKRVFREMANEGNTVFLSTHTLEVAEAICDRVAIINEGQVATMGTVAELKDLHTHGGGNLEDVFLELIGSPDDREVIQVLREDRHTQE